MSALPDRLKLPKNYRLIHEIVSESGLGRHLTMGEIYERTASRRPGIGYSTVYRGLVRLRDLGLISEIIVPGSAAATYEPVGPPHAHFRCSGCGTIEDIDFHLPQRTLAAIAQRNGVEVDAGSVVFQGRCASCRAISA
jgi:Fe2+ or Zn2+ uptake regulation protein